MQFLRLLPTVVTSSNCGTRLPWINCCNWNKTEKSSKRCSYLWLEETAPFLSPQTRKLFQSLESCRSCTHLCLQTDEPCFGRWVPLNQTSDVLLSESLERHNNRKSRHGTVKSSAQNLPKEPEICCEACRKCLEKVERSVTVTMSCLESRILCDWLPSCSCWLLACCLSRIHWSLTWFLAAASITDSSLLSKEDLEGAQIMLYCSKFRANAHKQNNTQRQKKHEKI